ncbi:hypothetical protein SARC_14164 [Sphaeroforma arctica JP610]|uniref:Uncharacterized protein n=1 Tax=Sphaeroforma arctica JP610 TaxID=667725 RepID=A0A0L0F974_9EUKA|nr:hypothetical protein SARC_14164 [Sphaeroforma arctica JP610]KNC73277.1 hypothetical protein SARC_14164 [Sphaeroforma arctica JP610]|eukprot:XP_014147179.1 hypothetical protein SARC_14164 [Sphaeroforma arctica JP610]
MNNCSIHASTYGRITTRPYTPHTPLSNEPSGAYNTAALTETETEPLHPTRHAWYGTYTRDECMRKWRDDSSLGSATEYCAKRRRTGSATLASLRVVDSNGQVQRCACGK